MAKRQTAKDLRNELRDLNKQITGCETRIKARAVELSKLFPDVVISKYPVIDRYVPIHAKDYGSFDDRSISDALLVIEKIEQHLAEQHPHKQTSIVCNCDGRDMPVYKEDGKYWCPQCGYEVI